MKFFILLSLISIESMAATSTLSCFGFHGPRATPDTLFAQDIDITRDINDMQAFFKTYQMINRSDFQISVVLDFPQRGLSLNLTKGETISMGVGKFEGTKLILANASTKKSLVYIECGVVTKGN